VEVDPSLAVDLLKALDLGLSAALADHVFMIFASEHGELLSRLTDEDVAVFLQKMMRLPEVKDHWIETFLSVASKRHAQTVAQFFMDRVNHAAERKDWRFLPCNYGPYGHVALRFRESPDLALVLRQVSAWIKSRDDLLFRERAAQLFDAMFRPFDDVLTASLQAWADVATESDIAAISKILYEAHATFIFEQRTFVLRFLEKAQQFGPKPVDAAISALYGSAIGGLRSGTPGQMKEEAQQIRWFLREGEAFVE
jgi:hypothetical protein